MAKKKFKPVKMMCPFCESDEFIRRISDVVNVFDRGAAMSDKLADEGDSILACSHCSAVLSDEELIKNKG